MNQRARELGCTDTNFANTHGLPNPNHYTTAWDFSRILREAATHELFMQISGTINYTVPDTNVASERRLENTNSLINPTNAHYPGDYGYEYAGGGKTGYTSDAGYCLAATAQKDGILLLSVVMKSEAYTLEGGGMYYAHFADTRTLFEWAFANFSYQEIVRSTEIVGEVPVEMGADADSVSIRPSTSITALLPNDVDLASFTRTVTIYPMDSGDALMAPVSAGQTVGEISVSLDGTVYGTASLVTSTSVDMSRTQFMRNELMDTLRQPAVIFTFWGLVLLFTLYLLLVVRYRAKRRAYQKRLEAARQVRLDLEDEEDEIRYERRVRSTRGAKPSPGKVEVALEPESLRKKEEEAPAAPAVDEPTRVSGKLPDVTDEPTRSDLPSVAAEETAPAPEEDPGTPEEPAPEDAPVRDYFEEFFGKK
jgi:D-alanyl-D-alanine carboxypeptidase (penicillin-binding protein 5/6)